MDIDGIKGFDEATSRNGGFIRSPRVQELIDTIVDKCVKRLERYIVDISWKDEFDKDQADPARMQLDKSSAMITQLVSRLAATEGVELLKYSPTLVRVVDEKSDEFVNSFKALEFLAEETGDQGLLEKVAVARARIEELQAAEAAAREAERKAEERAAVAEKAAHEAKVELVETEEVLRGERERNQFLVSAASLDYDTIMNLHHQIGIHAAAVHNSIKVMSTRIRRPTPVSKDDLLNFLDTVQFRNSQILIASRFASRGGYKEHAQARNEDLVVFLRDYVETVANVWAPTGMSVELSGDTSGFTRSFKPIEIGIIIDNLVSNAAKFSGSKLLLNVSSSKMGSRRTLILDAFDNGDGWSNKTNPLSSVFDKGVTTSTIGSGLGLYHVRQVIEGMGGTIDAVPKSDGQPLSGAHIRMRIPS
ncbi:MAG: sensor histidine kinase [Proteobacteria bacterium]|nr:MAG: sensor histidine kinase [Pseudomonadota bacterium]